MATRKDIRESFYAELETAADGHVASENIGQEYPEETEELPTIVHNDAYRRVLMNTNTGPTDYTTDESGNVQTLHYSETMEAQFTVLIVYEDDIVGEDAYEAVRRYFGQYERPIADVENIHADAYRIEVEGANSQDDEDRQPISRGDSLTISVFFERVYDRDVDHVESIDQVIDIGLTDTGDGVEDITHTIN